MVANSNYTLFEDEDVGHALSPNAVALEVEGPSTAPQHQTPTVQLPGTADVQGLGPVKRRRVYNPDVFTEQDKEIKCFQGFYAPWWKTLLYYTVALLTGGISLLVCNWSPKVHIALSLASCTLKDAQYVRIVLTDGRIDLQKVVVLNCGEGIEAPRTPLHPEDETGAGQGLLDWQLESQHRLLEYRCNRYFYIHSLNTFVPVPGVPKAFNEQLQKTAAQLAATGMASRLHEPDWDLQDRQMRYGANEMQIPVKTIPMLIFQEMWHPFYVFQYFSIIIWIVGDAYYSYSVCIAAITWFSIISSAVETHRNMKRLADIAYFSCEVEVLRKGVVHKMVSTELVPGDIMVVQPGTLPADLVLLRGECIVDENMLTGESVPVRKVCYSPVADGLSYLPDKSAACTLYGGTMVAQARASRNQKPIAMVCRTRFYSAKGQLLRSILFPREHSGNFISDSLLFITFMLVGCIGLYIWAAVVLASIGADAGRIVVRFFDMITIAVPPALPACLTIATVFSIGRLRKKDVYVTSPDRITVAGQLDVICFDKTGTLTEQGLDLQGIVPILNGRIHNLVSQLSLLPQSLVELLASCHGLAKMGDSLVGDPLDQKLFMATHWELIDDRGASADMNTHAQGVDGDCLPAPTDLHAPKGHSATNGNHFGDLGTLTNGDNLQDNSLGQDDSAAAGAASAASAAADEQEATGASVHSFVRPPGSAHSFAIIKRFEFNAALQRNLVVVRAPDRSVAVFVKGSPEMVRSLADPESVPHDFDQLLGELTREGLRVLALAQGDATQVPEAELMHWTQGETEAHVSLRLVGLAVMANPLRADTADVINRLQHAGIRTVMVTGDHLRTAISVAHKCKILPDQKPICLVDASDAPPTHSPPGTSPLHFSILNVDGTVGEVDSKAAVLPRIMTGELECAVTGKGFNRLLEMLDAGLLIPVLQRAAVFARMSPDNKRDLMELMGGGIDLIEGCPHLGLHAGFCGDGANDCGALKASHVGVSLCEAEASVAAPMTSKHQSIASMITVVAEGRCTLMATYQIFQFIIGYALVQAFETNLMYTYALNLGNYQYLIEDLFFTTVLAALMGFTDPRKSLSRSKPLSRVMSAPLMISTCLQLVVVVVFQLIALLALRRQPGYVAFKGGPELHDTVAPENTATYLIALAQFVILALVFNKGRPHRSPLWTNKYLVVALLLQTVFVIYSLFSTDKFNLEVQQLVDRKAFNGVFSTSFRWELLGIMVANGVAAVAMEYLSVGIVKLLPAPKAKVVSS